jgi:hypothetical protein
MSAESSATMVHTRLNRLTFQKMVFILIIYSWLLRVTIANQKLKRTDCVMSCSVILVRLSSSLFTMAHPQATKWEYCIHKWICLWIWWVSSRPQTTRGAPPDWECNRWLTTAHYYRNNVLRNVTQQLKFIRILWLKIRKNSETLWTIQ